MYGFITNLIDEERVRELKERYKYLTDAQNDKAIENYDKEVKSMQGKKSFICLTRVPEGKNGKN